MLIDVSGKVINKGTSKKGNSYVQVLVARPDGGNDVVTVMTDGGHDRYKVGSDVKIKANAFVRVCFEVK